MQTPLKTVLVALVATVILGLFSMPAAYAGDKPAKEKAPHGANRDGDFTPTDPKTTDPSNDHGNRPSDGSVGNADDKNPPGQSHKPEDHNKGYECDGNNGVGKGNPAHSACSPSTTVKETPPTTCPPVKETPPTTVKDEPKTPPTTVKEHHKIPPKHDVEIGTAVTLERPPAPQPKVVAHPQPVEASQPALANTGMTDWLTPLGLGLIAIGTITVLGTRKRHIAMELNSR